MRANLTQNFVVHELHRGFVHTVNLREAFNGRTEKVSFMPECATYLNFYCFPVHFERLHLAGKND